MATHGSKPLALALQGGGSHGAFTWGVLERLLEDERLSLDGFCGTSAGAMNATVLAYGLQQGGRAGAIALLERFWRRVADSAANSPIRPTLLDHWFGAPGSLDHSPAYAWMEVVSTFVAPANFNPGGYNPLRDILLELVDFEHLKQCEATRLFVCATNVRRGRVRVFSLADISVEAVLASACLPLLFATVSIGGEDYWDGGYMGNPPIFPLIDGTTCKDILLVQINPINIDETPLTAAGIRDRMNELSFNASLMWEMRRIAMVERMLARGNDDDGRFRPVYLHHINPERDLGALPLSSKMNASWSFVDWLRTQGRRHAEDWLATSFDHVGERSTCDVRATFL